MPQRPPTRKEPAPTEDLTNLALGYNGYTDPTLTSPKMWAAATNVFAGAFGFIQRARFANLNTQATGLPFTTLKYFALPGLSSYLLADIAGKLFSYDTQFNPWTQTQRLNPYVDPSGAGSSQLNGPWSRETLQNIVYEMNGQVKQAGRLANATTIEGWGLDAPDATPQITVVAAGSSALTSIQRTGNVVTAIFAALPLGYSIPAGVPTDVLNIINVSDPTFNGSFQMTFQTFVTPYTVTWQQQGQNTALLAGTGSITDSITKAVGRSYAYAWENANKFHVGAPSPLTQYILYTNQAGSLALIEPGTVTNAGAVITGSGTQFTSAWIGRHLWVGAGGAGGDAGRIISVQSATQLTLAATPPFVVSNNIYQVFDPQATHIRLYATSDGGATYFRIARNIFNPVSGFTTTAGLQFNDYANAEPPAFPFTTELAQTNNVPPPVGAFVNEYQGRLVVYGIPGAPQTFFYSNQEATTIGQGQESFAPLNQVTLPIQNASMNGMIEFPGSAIIWSDHQDMFRLTGLLSDNVIAGSVATATQQGATIARLPYNLGCASPFATAITPLGGLWLTPNAEVWLYTDRYAPRNVGRPVQDILNTISPTSLRLARATYYHTNTRNWFVLSIAANGATFNNTTLILDLDLLASNGSPSYFTFDMATNSPSWFVYQPGTTVGGNWAARCDSLEVVYEQNGGVRLIVGQKDLLQDIDFQAGPNGGFGTEIVIPNGTVTLHAWGNDTATSIKRPGWVRFNTNRDPAMIQSDGWTFAVQGIDDDFYTFETPLSLGLIPGVNDSSSLGGNPDFFGGLAFRHSPDLFRIGGVNFVMGRRLKFQINFPSGVGVQYRLRGVSFSFGAIPPS